MIDNQKKKTRGIDIMIDYSHDSDKEAAGWIKDLDIIDVQLSEANEELGLEEQTESQLWATVDWTPKGRKTLSDKEFAYLSADFDPNYKDNENPNHSFGAVLLGAGLTNRPVIKRMNPAIVLSEISENNIKEKKIMELENMKKELDQKTIKLSETEEKLGDAEKSLSDSEVKLAKIDELMNEMGVSSIEELMSKISEMKSSNVELAEEKEKNERESKLNVLLSEGKITEAQKKKAFEIENQETFNSYIELAEMNEQAVKLDESGDNTTPTEKVETEVEAQILELAEKKATEGKISMADAMTVVLSENKELASKYYNLGE